MKIRYYAYEDRERRHILVHHENCHHVRKRLPRWDDEWRDRWHDLEFHESPERAITHAHRVVKLDIRPRLCGHCERRIELVDSSS